MEELTTQFQALQSEYSSVLSESQMEQILTSHMRTNLKNRTNKVKCTITFLNVIFFVILPICFSICGYGYYLFTHDPDFQQEVIDTIAPYVQPYPCLIESNMFIKEIARPGFNCSVCEGLTSVPKEENISREIFTEKYAFTGKPVLVKGATENWTAIGTFNFDYFKEIYSKKSLEYTKDECQFFAYNTEFDSLEAAFEMDEERAKYKTGQKPWYFGWSNCDPEVKDVLRQHYSRPHFLPSDAEFSALDWIFMGGPGRGAHIHIDHVDMPSWQAQLSGSKTWNLYPSAECESVCHPLHITMNVGDILVVDTNQWFHSTTINQGDLSITIGSEYN